MLSRMPRSFARHLTLCGKRLGADTPKFGEPIQNQTIAVGREAVFNCVVDNLQTYKASVVLHKP